MYPGRNFPPRRQNRRENVNESIRAREVRAVFPDGTAEVMPTAQALRKAQELGLDLVVVSPTAVPPVAKAIDYGHYQYDLKKKQHEAKKKQHVVQVKELKFRPNTDDHDYEFKKNHAIRFLKEGNRVKAVVQFRGRETWWLLAPWKARRVSKAATPTFSLAPRNPSSPPDRASKAGCARSRRGVIFGHLCGTLCFSYG
jgi:translation initiation factor IF-3